MINPKELRTGNLVKREDQIRVVDQIGNGLITLNPIEGITLDVCQDSELNPIPLTHEILEKAGFSYHHTNPTVSEWFIHDNPNMLGAIVFEDDKYVYEGYKHEIKSVHQLQNLFHALTGEELEIKL